MTQYCQKLQQLIIGMQNDPDQVDMLEHDLQWLAAWNHPDDAALLAAALMSLMAKELREGTEHPLYVLDTLRCAMTALWPFIEEAPQEDLATLLSWYEIYVPAEPVAPPDADVVPGPLCVQWEQAQALRTLDGLRELARLKGLWLLKNDIPYPRRYQVVVPGSRSQSLLHYSEAAEIIETFQLS